MIKINTTRQNFKKDIENYFQNNKLNIQQNATLQVTGGRTMKLSELKEIWGNISALFNNETEIFFCGIVEDFFEDELEIIIKNFEEKDKTKGRNLNQLFGFWLWVNLKQQ